LFGLGSPLASTASVYFAVVPMTISPLLAPAFTFVLIFMFVFSFLEKLIEVDCGERRRPLSQVGESPWILLREYIFSVSGVPIGAEMARWQVVGVLAAIRRLVMPATCKV
jgi:hypothetical protein